MSELFENAVSSIRMGVEDYQRNDPDRAMSAVRNFYAGLLLLAKEVLTRQAPEADMDEIIGAKYKPVPNGDGGVVYEMEGNQTIDFNTISKRFSDFGLKIDDVPLRDLNRIRNDIEHKFTEQTDESVREAIAKAFPVAAELFRLADEDPSTELGDIWDAMVETRHLYEAELKRCKATLEKVDWRSETISKANLRCPDCGSNLVEQTDPENDSQDAIELRCLGCRTTPDPSALIVKVLEEQLAGEAFLRAKDAGEDGPIFMCPECGEEAYVDFEEQCANCGHHVEAEDCARCGNSLTMDELIYGEGSGLCGYCTHMAEKIMRE